MTESNWLNRRRIDWLFFKHDVRAWQDRQLRRLAWALPRRLVMWCFFRVGAHATTGQWGCESPTDLRFMVAADRWDTPHMPDDPPTFPFDAVALQQQEPM